MFSLVTLIGNAVVDPAFRRAFLADPTATINLYGVRMSKGEFDLMNTVFGSANASSLESVFYQLQQALYSRSGCNNPPCLWAIFPQPSGLDDIDGTSS